MIRTVDYSALLAPSSRAEVKTFRESVRSSLEYARQGVGVQRLVTVVGLAAFFGVGIAFLGVVLSTLEGAGRLQTPAIIPSLIVVGVMALVVGLAIRRAYGPGGRWDRWMRLTRFAEANGLVFSPGDPDPAYPGAIFGLGRSRSVADHLRSADGRFLDYGNYSYVTGGGKNQTTHRWGFMALHLDRALPHMVLDSKANNGLFGSNLPTAFAKDQVLSLEGDFDRWFTLYCPKRYERDALYVFTPDLMALLIDHAAPFDVEIVDRWMFVYSASPFDLAQPAIHQRLLHIVDTVGAKTLSQTDRYVDEQVGDFAANIVAPQGQRLKRGVSVGAVVAIAVVAAIWVGPTLMELLVGALTPGR